MLNTVLCVDDDPITLMLCKKVIIKAEFAQNIITAENGKLALALLEDIKSSGSEDFPQLVFLDLNMPVMNGWDFLDEFVKNAPQYNHPKVIILSSTIDPTDHQRAEKYEVVSRFMPKPITVEMLNELKSELKLNLS
ncbi:MAG: response regulator [Flavobacteriaceae bacterium]|jgi:CheY-like chemotaxis protein|nr:response regulator [Flavobacteriaceae bacterium]HTO35128.1 response regulator [Flavobacterium sp.]